MTDLMESPLYLPPYLMTASMTIADLSHSGSVEWKAALNSTGQQTVHVSMIFRVDLPPVNSVIRGHSTHDPCVPFACCDVGAGPIMVELEVTDAAGNVNYLHGRSHCTG